MTRPAQNGPVIISSCGVAMSCEELEIVWNNIKAEARSWRIVSQCWPVFTTRRYSSTKPGQCTELHAGEQAVIANYAAIAIREVVEEAYAADPEMIVLRPVIFRQCVPATRRWINTDSIVISERFSCLAGLSYRSLLWNQGRRALAIFLQNQVSVSSRLIFTRQQKLAAVSCLTTHGHRCG